MLGCRTEVPSTQRSVLISRNSCRISTKMDRDCRATIHKIGQRSHGKFQQLNLWLWIRRIRFNPRNQASELGIQFNQEEHPQTNQGLKSQKSHGLTRTTNKESRIHQLKRSQFKGNSQTKSVFNQKMSSSNSSTIFQAKTKAPQSQTTTTTA